MCGIVGLIDSSDKEIRNNINSMLDRIYLRGPDGEGRYSENGIELAMRRLSIIDLEGGTQPFLVKIIWLLHSKMVKFIIL